MYKTYLQQCLKREKLIRWPKSAFPLKFYLAPCRWYQSSSQGIDYLGLVKEALQVWSQVSNGVISFEQVSSLMQSQVNLDWQRVDRKALGYCTYNYDKLGRLYSAEVQIGLSDGILHKEYMAKEEVFHTILHEIGHALGLGHSIYKEDIMYTPHQYGVVNVSKNDVATLNWMYKIPNALTIEEACQAYNVSASTFDELVQKIDNNSKLTDEDRQKIKKQKEKQNIEGTKQLIEEHQRIGELKKYVMGLQNIQVSSNVSDYIRKNIR